MNFEVLYVEDEADEWNLLNKAIKSRNTARKKTKSAKGFNLSLKWAKDPSELGRELTLNTGLVLTDMVFPDPNADAGERNKLDDVIFAVEEWSKDQKYGSPLPIIALTGRGRKALDACLLRKNRLYDIWDKSSASMEYIAWRLFEIAKELSHTHPDALSQRLIREMQRGASWHEYVVEMTRGYDAGWTEYDQIQRAGDSIEKIALRLDVWRKCEPLWKAMVKWEPLSRAISGKTRGHARHVINVFWLGYYLLHHKHLSPLFSKFWEGLIPGRRNMSPVATEAPLEALSNSWFFAAIFHDVGGCVEKCTEMTTYQENVMKVFGDLAPTITKPQHLTPEEFMARCQRWLHDFDDPLLGIVEPVVRESAANGEPDQGVLGALYLREQIDHPKSKCYAIEGGRAMSLHNIFPKLSAPGSLPVTWEQEPLVCLLLLCDQLQTWDREPGTESLRGPDLPARAELRDLKVDLEDGRPRISMSVDYIAREHLDDSPDIYARTMSALTEVLLKNPYSALDRIQKPWPFSLVVTCTLSGDPLPQMRFG